MLNTSSITWSISSGSTSRAALITGTAPGYYSAWTVDETGHLRFCDERADDESELGEHWPSDSVIARAQAHAAGQVA